MKNRKEDGAVIAAKFKIGDRLESLPDNTSETSNGKHVNKCDDRVFKINPSMSKINPRSNGQGW
jgi:hypothetical protein